MTIKLKFDSSNPHFNMTDRDCNFWWLKNEIDYFNNILMYRGYMHLNQVYEEMGLPWNPDNENVLLRLEKIESKGVSITPFEMEEDSDGNLYLVIKVAYMKKFID